VGKGKELKGKGREGGEKRLEGEGIACSTVTGLNGDIGSDLEYSQTYLSGYSLSG